MLSSRPLLTLKDHLQTFLQDEKRSDQALITVGKIAKQTSIQKQKLYMEEALNAIKKSPQVEGQYVDDNYTAPLQEGYNNFKHGEAELEKIRNKYQKKKILTVFTRNAARKAYEKALYDYELAKSTWRAVQEDVYRYLERAGAEILGEDKNKLVRDEWFEAVDRLTSHSITLDDGTPVVTSILEQSVANYTGNSKSKAELSQALSRDPNMENYLFVKAKGEGYNKPGVYGGEYICCYAQPTGFRDDVIINVQRFLIKQDTRGAVIRHGKNITEFCASEVLNELVPTDDAASVFYLRAPWDTKGKSYTSAQKNAIDASGESVYIASVFFDGFTDLYKDLFERNKRPAVKSFYIEAALLIQRISMKEKAGGITLLEKEKAQIADFSKSLGELGVLIQKVYSENQQDCVEKASKEKNSKKSDELFHKLIKEALQKDAAIDANIHKRKEENDKPGKTREIEEIGKIYSQLNALLAHHEKTNDARTKDFLTSFNALKKEYKKIIEEPPEERPKGLNTPYERNFTDIFNKNILDTEIKDESAVANCAYDNYAPLTVASLLVRDFDTHIANFGAVPGEAGSKRKRLKRIDFGAAFKNLDEELHIHSHSRHLPGFGPTNHIREWPLELRTNMTFINELKKQGNHSYHDLCASIDRAMKKTVEFYGTMPMEDFARHLGLNVGKLKKDIFRSQPNASYHDKLIEEVQNYFKNVMWSRQLSMRVLALEFEMSLYAKRDPDSGKMQPNAQLDELIKQNPNYFLNGKFHFRHGRNKKNSSYEKEMRIYANTVLQKNDGLYSLMQKDFTCSDIPVRAKILYRRLKLLAQFEIDEDRRNKLQQDAENLLREIKKYRASRNIFSRVRSNRKK